MNGRSSTVAVNNVIAVLKGSNSGRALLLAAHYDTVANSPGASDDGAGVATLLETARALKSGPPLQNDLIFLFSDGEEVGLLGAEAFVHQHPLAKQVALALNFEARGASGPSVLFETSDNNAWLIDQFAASAPYPNGNSVAYEIYRRMPNSTDMHVFKAAGIAGLNFAYFDGVNRYHSSSDDLQNLSEASLQHHGTYALALAQRFGNASLDTPGNGNVVYFDLLRKMACPLLDEMGFAGDCLARDSLRRRHMVRQQAKADHIVWSGPRSLFIPRCHFCGVCNRASWLGIDHVYKRRARS